MDELDSDGYLFCFVGLVSRDIGVHLIIVCKKWKKKKKLWCPLMMYPVKKIKKKKLYHGVLMKYLEFLVHQSMFFIFSWSTFLC